MSWWHSWRDREMERERLATSKTLQSNGHSKVPPSQSRGIHWNEGGEGGGWIQFPLVHSGNECRWGICKMFMWFLVECLKWLAICSPTFHSYLSSIRPHSILLPLFLLPPPPPPFSPSSLPSSPGVSYFVYGEKVDVYGDDPQLKKFMSLGLKFIHSLSDISIALPLYKLRIHTKTYRDYVDTLNQLQSIGE